jgi:hypothetical protein
MAFKTESILPIQLHEKNREKSLSDLQTVGFGVAKNATMISDPKEFLYKDFRMRYR